MRCSSVTKRFSAPFGRMARGFDPSGVQYNCPVLLLRATTERNEISHLAFTIGQISLWSIGLSCWMSNFRASQNCEKRLLASSCPSVCPTVLPHGITRLSLDGFLWNLIVFRKIDQKIQLLLKSDMNNGYFTWRHTYIFDNISLSSSWNEESFRQKMYRKDKHIFPSLFFCWKSCRLWDNAENIVELGKLQMAIWLMRNACWTPKATNTHWEYVVLIAFPVPQWLQERALILSLCVNCLSFFYLGNLTPQTRPFMYCQ